MGSNSSEDPRVRFAIERTLLAWVRTGLALMGFGFVVARFGLFLREIEAARQGVPLKAPTGLSLWIGTALILLGVIVNLRSMCQGAMFSLAKARSRPAARRNPFARWVRRPTAQNLCETTQYFRRTPMTTPWIRIRSGSMNIGSIVGLAGWRRIWPTSW